MIAKRNEALKTQKYDKVNQQHEETLPSVNGAPAANLRPLLSPIKSPSRYKQIHQLRLNSKEATLTKSNNQIKPTNLAKVSGGGGGGDESLEKNKPLKQQNVNSNKKSSVVQQNTKIKKKPNSKTLEVEQKLNQNSKEIARLEKIVGTQLKDLERIKSDPSLMAQSVRLENQIEKNIERLNELELNEQKLNMEKKREEEEENANENSDSKNGRPNSLAKKLNFLFDPNHLKEAASSPKKNKTGLNSESTSKEIEKLLKENPKRNNQLNSSWHFSFFKKSLS
jgi:hypothetical protein